MYRILLDSKHTVKEVYERTKNDDYLQGEWVVVKNISDFAKLIMHNHLEQDLMPELISLEFNLGFDILDTKINPKAESGVDAVKWLVEFCQNRSQKLPAYLIHAENEQQKRDLSTILRNSKEIYKL